MEPQQVWRTVLSQLEGELSKAAFDTWVKNAEPVGYQADTFTIGVQNAYARDWLELRLTDSITQKLSAQIGRQQLVHFVVWHKDYELMQGEEEDDAPAEAAAGSALGPRPASINARYTFDNFVVGPSNELAHAASQAVAERPARAYNPLFLYGGVGLGKTHLLHAIGNQVYQQGLHTLYVSSEEFTNELIDAIRSHNTNAFRDRYRTIDVLLIDDIQFIAGKESTQEEFFHTFNTLYGQDKQIVITSDRPPKAFVTLEERLRSRFEWGLTADIQPPDFETRVAILRSKAAKCARPIPENILEAIAQRVQSNIRELEGALNRVIAHAELRHEPMTPELVASALADTLPERASVDPHQLVNAVAESFGVSYEQLVGRDRSNEVALPRQVAMYLLRAEAKISLPQIGEVLGGRDHSTVLYACDKIADLIERDAGLRRKVLQVRDSLYGRVPVAV
jgi:chromosomal replication initiator protein